MKKKFCYKSQNYRTDFKLLIFSLFMLLMGQLSAQENSLTVSGTVTDQTRQPLPGVTVVIQGTTNGTITDNNGVYTIKVPGNASLVFSFVGMKSQIVTVNYRSRIDVTLNEETIVLDEVIAVGYGTQRRSHFAGASSGINVEEDKIDEIPVESLDKALQGKLAGVQIRNMNGQVGESPQITIRGNTSFSGSNEPLVVIDGLPLVGGSLNDVNMGDVERVEVLKDAASTSIYGSRGANGVILVTTKQGSIGKPSYRMKLRTGFSNTLRYFDTFENYEEFARNEWNRLVLAKWETNFLKNGLEVPSDPENYADLIPFENYFSNKLNPETGKVYDSDGAGYYNLHRLNQLSGSPTPQESLTNNNAKTTNFSLSAQGGNEKTTYYISVDYTGVEGVLIKNDYQTVSINSNVKAKLSEKVEIELNLKPQYRNTNLSSNAQYGGALRWLTHPLYHNEYSLLTARRQGDSGYVPLWVGPGDYAKSRDFRRMYLMNDDFTDYVYDSKGKKVPVTTYSGTGAITAHSQVMETTDNREEYLITGNLGLNIEPLKNLIFRTTLGGYFRFTSNDFWQGSYFVSAGAAKTGQGLARYSTYLRRNLVNENTLTYKLEMGKHQFDFLAGFSVESYLDESLGAAGQFFQTDVVKTLNYAGEIIPGDVGNGISDESLVSLLGRVNYNYKDRYLLSLVARADASSQFGPGNRWGNFPSASVAWRVGEEDFMKNVNFINDLKLRASYGISGNNRISRYSYVTGVNKVQYIYDSEIVNGYAANSSTLGNYNIGWEQINATNLGLSVSIFDSRISLNIDTYLNKTKSLLLRNPIVNITGHEYEWVNIGKVESKGIEFELNTVNVRKKNFIWNTSFNISHNENKLINYGGLEEQFFSGYKSSVYRMKIGRPLGEFYGYKTSGEIWKTSEEIAEARELGMAFSNTTTGEPKYVDVTGDGKITTDDKTHLGDPYPDFEWGLTNHFTYKNIDFSFFFQGSQGSEVWNLSNILGSRYLKALNKDAYIDAFHGNSIDPNKESVSENDVFIEDASYVALRDVSLGYKLPVKKLSMRVFFSGRNLWYLTASGYNGLNPEYMARIGGNNLLAGEQRYNVAPLLRTFTFGLDVKF